MNRPLSTYLHRRVELTDEVVRAGELKELQAAPVRVVPDKRAELDRVPIVDVVRSDETVADQVVLCVAVTGERYVHGVKNSYGIAVTDRTAPQKLLAAPEVHILSK